MTTTSIRMTNVSMMASITEAVSTTRLSQLGLAVASSIFTAMTRNCWLGGIE
jgi:hypothetical protein